MRNAPATVVPLGRLCLAVAAMMRASDTVSAACSVDAPDAVAY